MKLGSENRNKAIAAAGLMLLAAILLGRMLFGGADSTRPSTTQVPAVSSPATPAALAGRAKGAKKVRTAPRSLDPSLRYDWLKASEDTKYEGAGRNIFRAEAEIPKPVDSGVTDAQKQAMQAPPQPPPPPPINLKFFGFANKPGEPKRIFLSQGEDVFIATEGEVIDRRYRVLRITPVAVEIEDVLNNNRQSIPLTQG